MPGLCLHRRKELWLARYDRKAAKHVAEEGSNAVGQFVVFLCVSLGNRGLFFFFSFSFLFFFCLFLKTTKGISLHEAAGERLNTDEREREM